MKKSEAFEQFGGYCAILAGILGVLYSLAFIVISHSNPQLGSLLSALFLLLGGLASTAALTALFRRLQVTDSGFAGWGQVLGIVGATGAMIHGAYDLANAIHTPESIPSNLANLPNAVDPRGLLTFGVAGIALLIAGWLITRGEQLPKNLGYLSYVLGILLIVIYLARLIILDATNPLIVVVVLITGFLINPVWNIWLGLSLRRA